MSYASDQGHTVDESHTIIDGDPNQLPAVAMTRGADPGGAEYVVRDLDDYYQQLVDSGYFENSDAGDDAEDVDESDGDAE